MFPSVRISLESLRWWFHGGRLKGWFDGLLTRFPCQPASTISMTKCCAKFKVHTHLNATVAKIILNLTIYWIADALFCLRAHPRTHSILQWALFTALRASNQFAVLVFVRCARRCAQQLSILLHGFPKRPVFYAFGRTASIHFFFLFVLCKRESEGLFNLLAFPNILCLTQMRAIYRGPCKILLAETLRCWRVASSWTS